MAGDRFLACGAGGVGALRVGQPAGAGALRAGLLLSLTNPQNVAYWAALGSAMGAVVVRDPSAFDYGVFFAGFMASSLVWAFVCAAFVARLFSGASAGWARLTYRACAIAFLLLALSSLRDLMSHRPGKATVSGVDRSGSPARWALRNASGEQPVQIPAARGSQFAVDP